MAEYTPLLDVLGSLGLSPASDLGDVVDVAWHIQQHRSSKDVSRLSPGDDVSRTSTLLACAHGDDRVWKLLEGSGLSRDRFAAAAGADDFSFEACERTHSVAVGERLVDGLESYARACPGRAVDALALAYAAVAAPGSLLDERIAESGGSREKGAHALLEELQRAQSDPVGVPWSSLEPSYLVEDHVESALLHAYALSQSRPIDARHALLGALVVARQGQAGAFRELDRLLNKVEAVPATPAAGMDEIALDSALAASYELSVPFFKAGGSVWGRDYITFVLLADDPSLDELASEAGSTLAELRDRWFAFVRSGTRRSTEEWKQWWRDADVPVPETVETTDTGLPTYLLTWNPDKFAFPEMSERVRERAEGRAVRFGWSSGNRTRMKRGARVFLMRQGVEPRGLVGAGTVDGDISEEPHWDPKQAAQNKTFHSVPVLWDALLAEPAISREELFDRFPSGPWDSAASGIEIGRANAASLAKQWEDATREVPGTAPGASERTPRVFLDTDSIPSCLGRLGYRPSEHDSLDVKTQAGILASLIVAKEVRAPFALGLLGDWGVGKTFFMRLMQENIELVAGQSAAAGGSPGSVSRAAQIEFNAWHYVDSDLWASLASHIFDELSLQLSARGDNPDEIRRRLRREIESSKKEHEQAQAAIETSQQAREEARLAAEQKRVERATQAARYDKLRLDRVWKAVRAVKPSKENPDWPDLDALTEQAQKTAKQMGLCEALDSVEQVQRTTEELRALWRRGGGLASALAADFTGGRAVWAVVVLVGLVALVMAWPAILAGFDLDAAERFKPFVDRLLQVGTVLSAGAVWVGRHLKQVSSALGYLEQINAEIRAPRMPLESASHTENALRQKVEELDAEIITQQRKVEEADRQIAAAQAEIQRIDAGGLVYDFLEGRVRDSRYVDRLGLISVIRKDFEALGTLLKDWGRRGREERAPRTPNVPWDTRPIERIVLYIDDLDRCPPDRVVEVLQAVHLLLAFDLFVVVVAVDARWLQRSLNESYNPSRRLANGSPVEPPSYRFSAHNYLEKIFQIPFSLPAMDEDGYQQLVTDMASTPRGLVRPEPTPEESSEPRKPAPEPTDVETKPDAPPRPIRKVTAKESADLQRQRLEQDRARERAGAEREERERVEAEARIQAIELESWEKEFIKALYPFIRTPRLAKRFLNIYRLLRVRAATSDPTAPETRPKPFSTFIERDAGEYRAVLLLLAISVGRPEFAPGLLQALDATAEIATGSFPSWLDGAIESCRSFQGADQTPEAAALGHLFPGRSRESASEIAQTLGQLRGDFDEVSKSLAKLKAPAPADSLKTYCDWAARVGRFSFHWHLNRTREGAGVEG